MTKQNEMAGELDKLKAQVVKTREEQQKRFDDLEASLANDDISEESQTALDALKSEIQTSDDVVADETTEPTEDNGETL